MAPPVPALQATNDALLRALLLRFPAYLNNAWFDLGAGCAHFGDGSNGENGIRSNANVAYTAALLAARADTLGIDATTADQLAARCRAVMRYLCRSHLSGDGRCANGGRWGLEWQSAWWATKLGLAARLLWPRLDAAERGAIERVITAEADRQLERIVPTGLHLDTKAEENAWDAEVLAAALALFPDHTRTPAWREKLIEFSANVFSSPHDRRDQTLLDGKPVRERVYTCNVHGDFSLENHGAYHFCYVASPLLSKAWCAYALRAARQSLPQALKHNAADVWALAENTFLGRRFAYISGQDWARYTYGEYFIVPALAYLRQALADERCTAILGARLGLLEQEARANDDGSFFGARFTAGRYAGQHGKYETDCYACVALAWSLSELDERAAIAMPTLTSTPLPALPPFRHLSPEGQFCFQRTPACFFSFSWSTLEQMVPNVCLVPEGRDDLAEWHAGNLIGTVDVPGEQITIGVRAMKASVDGGIDIHGSCLVRSARGMPLVEHVLSVHFDPRDASVHIHSRFVARSALRRVTVTGVNWRFPNDMFNGHRRSLHCEGGTHELRTTAAQRDPRRGRDRRSLGRRIVDRLLRSVGRDRSQLEALHTRWLNVDDALGLVVVQGAQTLAIRRFPGRQSAGGSLFVEQIDAPARRFMLRCRSGEVLLETSVIVHVGTAARTKALAAGVR